MKAEEAIAKMVSPRDKRKGIWRKGILQIWVTRACNMACFGCTQGSNIGGKAGRITLEQFETACKSLKDYFGVVGMFGGNPAMHPQFEELCEILRANIPFERRGIWCNDPLTVEKAKIMARTFNPAVSNLNVHLDIGAYRRFVEGWPECASYLKGEDTDSRHSPVYVAMKDLKELPGGIENTEENRWDLIADCDINKYWSAMIAVVRGELRGYFCEIAGAQAMLHENDESWPVTGVEIGPRWWDRPIQDFSEQIKLHCHSCSVPLKIFGELAIGGKAEYVSLTHADIMKPKDKNREVVVVEELENRKVKRATDYLENGGLKE